MNQSTEPEILKTPLRPELASRPLPRLIFPGSCLVMFWVVTISAGFFDKPYFIGFMIGMLSAALVTLLFLGWWWCNRGLRLWEKVAGFALIALEIWAVGKSSHRSVNFFNLWMIGLPVCASLIIVWLFLLKRFPRLPARAGFATVVTLGWACFLLVRIDGADASLHSTTHWRWTPTTEERFLAQASPQNAPPADSSVATSRIVPGPRDWLEFRGPHRDGVIQGTTISTNWSVHAPTLVWKQKVGPAWSSLVLVANRLYTQEQRGPHEDVVCYDAATGQQLWVHEDVARFEESVSGPGPRATPTFANGRLYTVGGTGLLNCLDASSGAVVWKRDMRTDAGAGLPMWAFSGSPLVTSNLVIAYAGGDAGKGLLAYRIVSGELVWAVPAGNSSYSSPQLTVLDGVAQCLMLHDAGLTSVDLNTGHKLWETGVPMKGAPRCGQPRLLEGNRLMVAALGGLGCSLIEISTNGNSWTVTNKWDSKDLKPEFPDFVTYRDHAYGFDIGMFCCLRLSDGKRAWKEGRYGRGEVMLLLDQKLLLVTSETGELILLAADSQTHRELGRIQALDGKTWNHPVVRGGTVYLRNAQEMRCYDAGHVLGVAARQ